MVPNACAIHPSKRNGPAAANFTNGSKQHSRLCAASCGIQARLHISATCPHTRVPGTFHVQKGLARVTNVPGTGLPGYPVPGVFLITGDMGPPPRPFA
eukprot:2773600-Rhodomonas_salina.1